MRYLKTYELFGDTIKNFFKSEPSDEIKTLNQEISKSFEKHFPKDNQIFFHEFSKVIGLYNKIIKDIEIKSEELLGCNTYSENEKLVDNWMKDNNQDIYDFNHKYDD